jgi:DNA-binding CsgD family transcriptional regulator
MGTVLCPVVVGRTVERGVLSTALDAAAHGAGATILLSGEAGVGKSRLVRELRKRCVDRGGVALGGRAVDTATPTPFRPLSEALMAAQRSGIVVGNPDVAPFQAALDLLLLGGRADGSAGGLEGSILHVAEGFLRVMRTLGRHQDRGVVVVLEDLHWADVETMEAFEYLADNVVNEPVLLVATTRLDFARDAVRSVLSLADRRAVTHLHLDRLSAAQTVEMTRRCLGEASAPAEVVQLVSDRADGLPFFVEELLTGLQSDGSLVRENGRWVARESVRAIAPATFAGSVRLRFGSLSPRSRPLLINAALLGRWIDLDVLAGIGRIDRAAAREALQGAVEVGLLSDDESGLRFRHALTRDVLIADLRPADRAARAKHLLKVLREASAVLFGVELDAAADLAEWAGEHAEAAELLLRAARRALEQGALTSAESALRRAQRCAVDTSGQLEVLETLVGTLALAGRVNEVFALGQDVLMRIAAAAEIDPGGRRRAAVHLALARSAVACTDWSRATVQLASARECIGDTDISLVARVTALQAVVALGEYRHAESGVLAEAAVNAAESTASPDLLCEALLVLGRCTRESDLTAAELVFERARVVARNAGLTHWQARALAELGTVDFYRGGGPGRAEQARALARECGAPETEAVAEQHLSVLGWNRDDADVMRAHAEAAIGIARRYRLGLLLPSALILLACAHAVRGNAGAMEQALAEAAPLIEGDPTQTVAMHAQARATCALAGDDLATARVELAVARQIVRSNRTAAVPMVGMSVLLAAVDGADTSKDSGELRTMGYHQMQPLSALLLAADAVVLGRAGHPARANLALAQAMTLLETQPFMRAVCLRLVAPCAAADGWGEPAEWLLTAQLIFEERGLPQPAQSVLVLRRQLAAGRKGPSSPDYARFTGDITVRERQVLGLVAEGLPNRSIAARLYLSPRTVEKHVERLMAKTGSTNRAQLAIYVLRQTSRS